MEEKKRKVTLSGHGAVRLQRLHNLSPRSVLSSGLILHVQMMHTSPASLEGTARSSHSKLASPLAIFLLNCLWFLYCQLLNQNWGQP